MMNSSSRGGRRGPRLILALALGAAAAAGVYLYVNSVNQAAQQRAATLQAAAAAASANAGRSKVVVAKQNLAAQTTLTADNVELKDVATDALQPNPVTALNDAIGKVLNTPVAQGEQILTPRIGNPDQPDVKKFADLVPAGKRAMSVEFSELSSAGGLIAPGDYVDVVAVFNKNTLGKD